MQLAKDSVCRSMDASSCHGGNREGARNEMINRADASISKLRFAAVRLHASAFRHYICLSPGALGMRPVNCKPRGKRRGSCGVEAVCLRLHSGSLCCDYWQDLSLPTSFLKVKLKLCGWQIGAFQTAHMVLFCPQLLGAPCRVASSIWHDVQFPPNL